METIRLDFAECADRGDINRVLKRELDLPDYQGESWDELWACMRQALSDPICAEISGIKTVWEDLGDELDDMLDVFEQMSEEGGFFYRVTE